MDIVNLECQIDTIIHQNQKGIPSRQTFLCWFTLNVKWHIILKSHNKSDS